MAKYTICACDNLRNAKKVPGKCQNITGSFLRHTKAGKQKGRQADKQFN